MNSKRFDLDTLAADIYNEVYGDIDSKPFRAQKQTEIRDWLADGDLTGATFGSLVADWREYDSLPDGMADESAN